jgi:hypothetical protein
MSGAPWPCCSRQGGATHAGVHAKAFAQVHHGALEPWCACHLIKSTKGMWELEVDGQLAKPIMGPQDWGHPVLRNLAKPTKGA